MTLSFPLRRGLTGTDALVGGIIVLAILLVPVAPTRAEQDQVRKARYESIPIADQLRPGDRHVILIDDRLMTGDGPLLGLPAKPYKYPDVMRDIVRGTQAAVIAEVTRSEGALIPSRDYISATITLRVIEVVRRGSVVREGTELQARQEQGGSVTIDGVLVDLLPAHVRIMEVGKKYFSFVRESQGLAEVLASYELTDDGVLKGLDLLRRPKASKTRSMAAP